MFPSGRKMEPVKTANHELGPNRASKSTIVRGALYCCTCSRPVMALFSLTAMTRGGPLAGRVEDGRGSLGHAATLRFPSPLIEPDVPISGIRLSDWLHREAHGATVRARSRRSTPRSP